jgi:tRNA1Val (adenine37-N6)-methyltransferase
MSSDVSRFRGWLRPGPVPPGGDEPGEDETLDALCGHFRIFQYADGQRFTTDDVLCAWYATQWAPRVDRAADLGSGIGSIAMMMAWRLPGARIVTVEAQEQSIALARRSVRYNGLEDRMQLRLGDIRDPEVLAGEEAFDLVTAAPPYFSPGTVTEASHKQAKAARSEMRGGVADYALAASRILAPGGSFVMVFPTPRLPDAAAALREAGLTLVRRRDVAFKKGQDARLSLLFAMRAADLPEDFVRHRIPWVANPLAIRTARGLFTPDYATVRLTMGLPPGEAEE